MSRRTAKDILDSKKVKDNALTWDLKKSEINTVNKNETFDISKVKINLQNVKFNNVTKRDMNFINVKPIVSDEEIAKIKNHAMRNVMA